jgi:hypothetical protein
MLGEKIAEVTAKVTTIRVLPQVGPESHFEISVQGVGTLLGVEVACLATYHQVVRADKTIFCPEGHVTLTSADGDSAYWTGFAIGAFTGKPPASRIAPCGHMQTTAAKWARLARVAIVTEWVVAEDGTGKWTVWEWK